MKKVIISLLAICLALPAVAQFDWGPQSKVVFGALYMLAFRNPQFQQIIIT